MVEKWFFWNSPAFKKKKASKNQTTRNAERCLVLTFATLNKKALFRGDRQVLVLDGVVLMKSQLALHFAVSTPQS